MMYGYLAYLPSFSVLVFFRKLNAFDCEHAVPASFSASCFVFALCCIVSENERSFVNCLSCRGFLICFDCNEANLVVRSLVVSMLGPLVNGLICS